MKPRFEPSVLLLCAAVALSACSENQLRTMTPAPGTAQVAEPAPVATTVATPAGAATAAPIEAATEVPRIHVTSFDLASKALEGNLLGDLATRKIFIYLPPSYTTSSARDPVVYVMPWGTGESSHNAFTVSGKMDKLVRSDEVKEMILVYPDGHNSLDASLFRSTACTVRCVQSNQYRPKIRTVAHRAGNRARIC